MFGRSISMSAIALSSLATLTVAPAVAQQESGVLTGKEARGLVAERSGTDSDRRAALDAFLEKPAVREAAQGAGIDIGRVESAAATLSDDELRRLEPRLRDANAALAGGDTLVIGTTTIIIALLVIILIIVA